MLTQDSAAIQDNLPPEALKARAEWRAAISAPAYIVDFLFSNHYIRSVHSFEGMRENKARLIAHFERVIVTCTDDRYVRPAHIAYDTVQKLGTGFAMPAAQMAGLFKDDKYIGADIIDVLRNPKTVAGVYPARTIFTAFHVVDACLPFLYKDYVAEDSGLMALIKKAQHVSTIAWPIREKQESTLTNLYDAQMFARYLPKISDMLGATGQPNLAVLADAFTKRMTAMADDIFARADEAWRWTASSAGPKGPVFR